MRRPIVWSVAGSDSGGGAGIQADLRAFDAFGVHGCTALAAITAQNSVAVKAVEAVSPAMLDAQLAALADDMPPVAIKTGLLGSAENMRVVARWVRQLRQRASLALVIDPVRRASTGAGFVGDDARQVLLDELLPLATAITPNRAEASWLLGGAPMSSAADVEAAAQALSALGPGTVLITGGDEEGEDAVDCLLSPQARGWLALPRIDTPHHHGTGCTFASSMAAALGFGFCEADAAVLAKMATAHALEQGGPAGAGAGPVRAQRGFGEQPSALPQLRPFGQAHQALHFPPTGPEPMGLYAVVDSADWVARAAELGIRTVQLRIKQAPPEVLDHEVRQAVAHAEAHRLKLFINDHWALALKHRAYGVHLGQEDIETADLAALSAAGVRLGVSTHAPWEVARAKALNPSYFACGPVHATRTKDMPWVPQGERNLAWWCRVLPVPVVAIGGMDPGRAAVAIRCGADAVAVLSGITAARDPRGAVNELAAAIAGAREQGAMPAEELPHPTFPPAFSRDDSRRPG